LSTTARDPAAAPPPPPPAAGWRTDPRGVAVLLGLAQTLAWGTTYYLPAVLAPAVVADLGADPTWVFGAFSLALLIAGLAAPRTGRAIERRGGRPGLLVSSGVLAAGLVLLGLLPGLWGWFLGWVVLGLGMALGLYEAAFATLGVLFGRAARRPITYVTLLAGFASTVGWPMTAALLPQLGWRGTCLAYAAINLAVVLPLYLLLPPRAVETEAGPNGPGGTAPAPPEPPPPDPAWARRAFLLLAVFFTIRAVVSSTFSVHFVVLLGGLGLSAAAAVGIGAMLGPSQVGGRVLEFVLGARAHPLTMARLGAALLPLGAAILLLLGPGAAAAFVVCYGASNGIMTISRGAVPLALFGPRGYPTLMGRLALPILLAQAAAPMATAPVVAAVPAPVMFGAAGALALLALLCLLPLRAPPPPPPPGRG
jgi:MFS family permease